MNGKLDFVTKFVLECLSYLLMRGNIVSGAPLGTRILRYFHNNSLLMIDHVEMWPWHDRHQFNVIVLFFHEETSIGEVISGRNEFALRNTVCIM